MPALALSRVGARVVESGPGGQDLAAGAWQRLEALPDPRSRRGRIYPLACLIAIAVCAFTAAGNDRFTAVGQWIRRAGQEDLARMRAPWDPIAGRYRAPDEKTIRVVLDRLDPRALARALLGPRPRGRRRPGGPFPAGVRSYRARRAAQQAKALARGRLRAVAVDGKTSRGARRADGTRVHLLGAAEHGGRLLDHLEVDVKHNETSHFTELLDPLDLAGAVVTFDALHTVRANLDWLATEAWVANTDRHDNNWAVLRPEKSSDEAPMRLCGSYDHASSLGFNVRDDQCRRLLENGESAIKTWCGRGYAHRFDLGPGRHTLVDLAVKGLFLASGAAREYWPRRLREVDEHEVRRVLDRIPRMSDPARRFATSVLDVNRRRVLDAVA